MKYKDFLEINNIKLVIVGDKKEIVYFGTKDEENAIYIKDYFKDIKAQIFNYLNKNIKELKFNIRLEGTEFQKKVWTELKNIKYGETISYEELAIRVNNKKGVRAVANAVAKNPILILIPCHRVIRKNKEIGNYSAGKEMKEKLLILENS